MYISIQGRSYSSPCPGTCPGSGKKFSILGVNFGQNWDFYGLILDKIEIFSFKIEIFSAKLIFLFKIEILPGLYKFSDSATETNSINKNAKFNIGI
jgi:hypothetical protein